MTAIVGILNKRAVAIAADSATTVSSGNEHKIYNTAQKIFRLSKKQPVGVMLFNNTAFMGVPWEVLIKLYHDRYGDKDLPTIEAYRDDFISFLKNGKYFTSEEEQKEALSYEIRELINAIYEHSKEECAEQDTQDLDELPLKKQLPYYRKTIKSLIEVYKAEGVCDGFEKYTFEQFQEYTKPIMKQIHTELKEAGFPTEKNLWEEPIYEYIRSKQFLNFTGLVFVGYGSEQIYPALSPILINIAFDGHLRTYTDKEIDVQISNENDAEIRSYAQDDVIKTLLRGLAPDVRSWYKGEIQSEIAKVKKNLIENSQKSGCDEAMIESIEKINETEIADNIYSKVDESIQKVYLRGLFRSIASFNVPDMANMAESLISVTNLQRHITSSEESVGGPVDVAVITRSEGFVWIKHKEWFEKEKN